MDGKQLLFALVQYVICDTQPQMQILENCTPELLASVAALAEQHDLAHLVVPECPGWVCRAVKPGRNAARQ